MKKIILALAVALLPFFVLADAQKATIAIKGMHCASCVKKVTTELKKLSEVSEIKMDLKKGLAVVAFKEGAAPNADALKDAVKEAGFEATKIEGLQVSSD